MFSDFVHRTCELVVKVAIESVELLRDIESDDGYFALVFNENAWLRHVDSLLNVVLCVDVVGCDDGFEDCRTFCCVMQEL